MEEFGALKWERAFGAGLFRGVPSAAFEGWVVFVCRRDEGIPGRRHSMHEDWKA